MASGKKKSTILIVVFLVLWAVLAAFCSYSIVRQVSAGINIWILVMTICICLVAVLQTVLYAVRLRNRLKGED